MSVHTHPDARSMRRRSRQRLNVGRELVLSKPPCLVGRRHGGTRGSHTAATLTQGFSRSGGSAASGAVDAAGAAGAAAAEAVAGSVGGAAVDGGGAGAAGVKE